jgi:hypothetical protein
MSSKVVASHDIGSVRQKLASNPNLSQDLISKRMEQAEEESQPISSVPKELKGLEDLVFLGSKTTSLNIGSFQFSLKTISLKDQETILKNALSVPEEERIFFFKKGLVALSLDKINGKKLDLYFEEDTFEARMNLVQSLQQSVFDILFEKIDEITTTAKEDIKVENLKK